MRLVQTVFTAMALFGLPVAASACMISHTSRILHETQAYAAQMDLVVLGRVISASTGSEDGRLEQATVEVESIFKGRVPSRITFRYRYDHCIRPLPHNERVYLFLREDEHAPGASRMNFIIAARTPADFESRLGKASRPAPGELLPPPIAVPRLAPDGVPAASVVRVEGEVVQESWIVKVADVRHWAIPRFYIRYPNAFVFFDPDDVRTAVSQWDDPDLIRGVLNALPLKAPTDLYQYTLMGRVPRAASPALERLAIDSLLSGRAIVFASSGYLQEIKVTRTSAGEQMFSFGEGTEFLKTQWTSNRPGSTTTAIQTTR